MNDLITVGVLQALDLAGASVSQDTAYIEFDDVELAAVLRTRFNLVCKKAKRRGKPRRIVRGSWGCASG